MRHATHFSLKLLLSLALLFGLVIAAQDDHADIPEHTYTATEQGFEGPDEIEGGIVRITLQNETEHGLELQIMRLLREADDEEIIAAIEGIWTAEDPEAVAEADERILELGELYGGPGYTAQFLDRQTSSAIVELDEGEYVFTSFGVTEEGEMLPAIGFLQRVNITAPAEPAQAPQADLTVQMVDFAFAFPPNIQPGAQTWEVVNRGQQPHHLIIMTFLPGMTMADLQAFIEAGEEGPPPVISVDGTTILTTGQRMFVDFDLEPGSYIAVCFVHDPETGLPHVDLGMLAPFTVEGNEVEDAEDIDIDEPDTEDADDMEDIDDMEDEEDGN
jgi:hypothetical protein